MSVIAERMDTERRWNGNDREKLKYSKVNLCQYLKSRVLRLGLKLGLCSERPATEAINCVL